LAKFLNLTENNVNWEMIVQKDKLELFQELIGYEFKNEKLLIQSLTTPQLGNEIGQPHYDFLETLGDAVIKIIFILKLSALGLKDPGTITKRKAQLESDNNLIEIANKLSLADYIYKAENQDIKDNRVLADVFEALCGAIFLDSDWNLGIVKKKMIDPFFGDLNLVGSNSMIPSKNALLEYLQKKYKTKIAVKLEYEKRGPDDKPTWISKNPKLLVDNISIENLKLLTDIRSEAFNNKQEADKDIYFKILKYLKSEKI